MKPLAPFEIDEDDITLNLDCTLANEDWIRTARLSKKEQEKRDNIIMYTTED